MTKVEDLYLEVNIYDSLTGETLVHGSDKLGTLNDDKVQEVAAGIAYGLIEEAYGLIEKEEEDV